MIRRLPPSLTKEDLEEQLQPLPELDYLEFFSSDTRFVCAVFHKRKQKSDTNKRYCMADQGVCLSAVFSLICLQEHI